MSNNEFQLKELDRALVQMRKLAANGGLRIASLIKYLRDAERDSVIEHKMIDHPDQRDCPGCRGYFPS